MGVLRVKVDGEWVDVGVAGSSSGEKVPAGSVFSTVAVVAPIGYLILDGTTVTNGQSLYPNLWAVIPAAWKSGTSIVLPDARGRAIVGAGTGAGLTNRPLASAFGEERHTLTTAELAAHAHAHNPHAHVHNQYDIGTTDWFSNQHKHGINQYTGYADVDHSHQPGSGAGHQFAVVAGSIQVGVFVEGGGATSFKLAGSPTGNATTSGFSANHRHAMNSVTDDANANHYHDIAAFTTTEQNATSTEQNAGSGTPHNVVQPSIALNWIIKT